MMALYNVVVESCGKMYKKIDKVAQIDSILTRKWGNERKKALLLLSFWTIPLKKLRA